MTAKGPKQPKPAPPPKPSQPVAADPAHAPEQSLVDTPAAPWERPAPAQKAAAQPVKDALAGVLAEVETPEDAEGVLDQLEAAVGNATVGAVTTGAPPNRTVDEAAGEVKRVSDRATGQQNAAEVLAETARAVETTTGLAREALAEAAQEALNPEQQGALPTEAYVRRRTLLRQALWHRLKPANALDAKLFIQLNHLPHNHLTNGFFYLLTFVFNGGGGWYAMLGAAALINRKWDWNVVRTAVVPLVVSTALVEYPVKAFFRRRRPFIDIVRAIVVGKKPGTWSFPSGHSASAFAGAWLLRQCFPRLTPLFYTLAGLVAFSRIYLGDHYPGDVVTGSVAGHFLAQGFYWLMGGKRRKGKGVYSA